ncbi:dr1-associated corepressor [Anthonomus grandis grandis]|uniref:dr1-associated corepressor n=1 Tax=Anthonomus grandis grandis TaxID=2921223 RepID=UPI0021660C25|nr:dr1-associated corepressor [Anthonomus grandis grandis]
MPSKKKKYNARFPAGRIKKIMQTDEEVGKVAQAVPVIISKALEMFIESLLKKSMHVTLSRNAKTLTPSHMKQCILSENRFDFLKDLVKNIPDASIQEDNENNALAESNLNFGIIPDEPGTLVEAKPPPSKERRKSDAPSAKIGHYSEHQSTSSRRTPVIQFGPKVTRQPPPDLQHYSNFSVENIIYSNPVSQREQPKLDVTIASQELTAPNSNHTITRSEQHDPAMPPLAPLSIASTCSQSGAVPGDNLCIDEDYDN